MTKHLISDPEEYYDGKEFPYWPDVEHLIAARYDPNPWLFKSLYQPELKEQRYMLTYRNFDGSKELVFMFERRNGQWVVLSWPDAVSRHVGCPCSDSANL